jgi:hypothetical protein
MAILAFFFWWDVRKYPVYMIGCSTIVVTEFRKHQRGGVGGGEEWEEGRSGRRGGVGGGVEWEEGTSGGEGGMAGVRVERRS